MLLIPRLAALSIISLLVATSVLGGTGPTQEAKAEARASAFLAALEKRDWKAASRYVEPSDLTRLQAESERLEHLGQDLQVRGAGYWTLDPTEDTGPIPLLYSLLEIAPGIPVQTDQVRYRIVGSCDHGLRSFVAIEVTVDEQAAPQLRVLPLKKHDDTWWIAIDYALATSEMRTDYLQQFLIDE